LSELPSRLCALRVRPPSPRCSPRAPATLVHGRAQPPSPSHVGRLLLSTAAQPTPPGKCEWPPSPRCSTRTPATLVLGRTASFTVPHGGRLLLSTAGFPPSPWELHIASDGVVDGSLPFCRGHLPRRAVARGRCAPGPAPWLVGSGGASLVGCAPVVGCPRSPAFLSLFPRGAWLVVCRSLGGFAPARRERGSSAGYSLRPLPRTTVVLSPPVASLGPAVFDGSASRAQAASPAAPVGLPSYRRLESSDPIYRRHCRTDPVGGCCFC